jgi:GNAT superfamily N-acetyltransferase
MGQAEKVKTRELRCAIDSVAVVHRRSAALAEETAMSRRIRKFASVDTPAIVSLFRDTVHRINGCDYSAEQIEAWAPEAADMDSWRRRLEDKATFVAEEDDKIVGFAELEANGYIDCLYCHADYQHRGIGSALLYHVETRARRVGLSHLEADISVTARPFFERKGFVLIRAQNVERHGVPLLNYYMKKQLDLYSATA